jgi:phosphoribosylamine--glycine ligase
LEETAGVVAFHAGTSMVDGNLVTAGGRVLGITAFSDSGSVRDMIDAAYRAVHQVSFKGMHCRSDIGKRFVSSHYSTHVHL